MHCGRRGVCCREGFAGSPALCGHGRAGCVGHHCCVLAAPPPSSPPPTTLAFFGMAEAYDASVCLFWFQSGLLTPTSWRHSDCTCARRAALRARLQHLDHQLTRTKGVPRDSSTSSAPELNVSRADLEVRSPGDAAFYRMAWREFDRRVVTVEALVGHQFMHCPEQA